MIIFLDGSEVTLNEVHADPNLTLLCSGLELTSQVDTYSAVMSKDNILINNGDYIRLYM